MNFLICPVCGAPLRRADRSFACKKGHNFDLSASGYLHLLPANKMHSKLPGDNKPMVNARRQFLEKGYYAPISRGLNALIAQELQGRTAPLLLDVGCGEGYYTTALQAALQQQGLTPAICGMDISKIAVGAAAKSNRSIMWAVASAFDLPVADSSCDVLVSMFAPICIGEFHRVLKKGGSLVFAITSTRHLWQLKQAIYDTPYENRKTDHQYEGFNFERREKVHETITIPSGEDIRNLFTMTPYYYKSSVETSARVAALQSLTTEIDVDLLLYRKN